MNANRTAEKKKEESRTQSIEKAFYTQKKWRFSCPYSLTITTGRIFLGDATSFMARVIQDIASRARSEFPERNRGGASERNKIDIETAIKMEFALWWQRDRAEHRLCFNSLLLLAFFLSHVFAFVFKWVNIDWKCFY